MLKVRSSVHIFFAFTIMPEFSFHVLKASEVTQCKLLLKKILFLC